MENSELQEQIINLGKLLVSELELDNRSDTISRWMAHYVAEKISIAENSKGGVKLKNQRECFATILKLWEIRWNFPESNRPLKNFELIMDFIQNLDDSNNSRYFIRHEKKLPRGKKEDKNPVKQWLDTGKEIDNAAKTMMNFILEQAALNASDQKTKEWLANSKSLPNTVDIQIIHIILGQEIASEKADFECEYEIEQLRKKIKEIEALNKICDQILENYKGKLRKLQRTK